MPFASASDLNLHWPAVRAARIDRAHAVLASLLLRDEQMSPDHVRDVDDSEAVVFSLLVPNIPRGVALSEEVGPALLRAGFVAVSYGQPRPTPGTDGYTCEFAVTVGAP